MFDSIQQLYIWPNKQHCFKPIRNTRKYELYLHSVLKQQRTSVSILEIWSLTGASRRQFAGHLLIEWNGSFMMVYNQRPQSHLQILSVPADYLLFFTLFWTGNTLTWLKQMY